MDHTINDISEINSENVPIREEWYDEWLRANAQWPQDSLAILFTLGDQLAGDVDNDINALSVFANSELTSEQLLRTKRIMTNLHLNGGIPVIDKDLDITRYKNERVRSILESTPEDHIKRVPDISLHRLWKGVKTSSMISIATFLDMTNRTNLTPQLFPELYTEGASTEDIVLTPRIIDQIITMIQHNSGEGFKIYRTFLKHGHNALNSEAGKENAKLNNKLRVKGINIALLINL